MTKRRRWKVGYNVALEPDLPVKNARYVQAGIVRNGYFTGYIHDYAGGGSWVRVWFLNGHRFMLDGYDDRYNYISKVARRNIELNYPGLCDKIDKLLRYYVYWRDATPYATLAARAEEENFPPEKMISDGTVCPMNIGNTMFDTALPELSKFIVMPKGKILTEREFERYQWNNDIADACRRPFPGALYAPNRCRGETRGRVTSGYLVSLDPVANSDLIQDMVPHPDCEWKVFAGFAQTFNPYKYMGINVVRLREIAGEAQEFFSTKGKVPEDFTLSELRACLFYYHRVFYYAGKRITPSPKDRRYLEAILEKIHLIAKRRR